ncbi:Molybdopterin or thiamine biosynthesis adenylyltransferase [Methylobacterium phyllostachyos]|uniref:Molybdopterin or thiamine biosynthesis adenylyltransferase n=1 Tax=Methylobacterium phyllostachyos TaxID=582672 RepID=A0A1H0HU39_9HYPH|nr:E2 ligase fold family C protein [Methylobacterium phyllostachyos]SDO22725.1 Molybdopterin or thiamine biosynthesis adenylyltransferase [Methylobacterium phyllostachyos]
MALANFFDRVATAASQVLAGFGMAAFSERLQAQAIGIAFDGEAAGTAEGAALLDLTVRLLARLYPRLVIHGLDDQAATHAAELTSLARSINPAIHLEDDPNRVTIAICVGRAIPDIAGTKLFAGSDGWTARFSSSNPIGCGASANPFGAGAAACIAVANVFRAVFADQIPGGSLDAEITLDLRSYRSNPTAATEGEIGPVDLGETHLVGLGAIGNGGVWALSRLTSLTGTLHLIDHESVDLSNLQRYALMGQADVDTEKVAVAASLLGGTGLNVVPHRTTWGAYLASRDDWHLERVAVALDTARDRIAVQGALPRWIVNAWTQEGDLGVSRHGFADGRACLACLYLPAGEVKDEDDRIAEELGLPEAQPEVRRMLQTSEPVSIAFVERIATALGIPFDALRPFAEQPLRSFYQSTVCGGVVFRLTDGGRPIGTTVPMAFQSALAGILLAADLVKHAKGELGMVTTTTRFNLLRPLGTHFNDPHARDATGRCICGDRDYTRIYNAKYADRAPATM